MSTRCKAMSILSLWALCVVLLAGGFPSSSSAVETPRGAIVASIPSPKPNSPDLFGDAVAIWGNTLLVGAPQFNNNMGRAYIYSRSAGGIWPVVPTVTLKDPHNRTGDYFGYNEVALYEGTAVVCGHQAYGGQGACYIYVRNAAGNWPAVPTRILRDPARPALEGFGLSMAIWDDTIVIGTGNSNVRAAYLYQKGLSWPVNPTASMQTPDDFGWAVAVFNKTVLIGDPNVNDVGAGLGVVYVFLKKAGPWPVNATFILHPPVPADAMAFGCSVAIDKSAIVVGDQGYRPAGGARSSGAAYIYKPVVSAAALPVRTLLDPADAQGTHSGTPWQSRAGTW